MQHIVDRNQEVLNNFIKAIEELAILRDNLHKKEVRHKRLNVSVWFIILCLLCYRTQSTQKKRKVHKKKRKEKQLTTNNMCTDHQLIP